jgi:small neutral amino acid transporter SnatA (MarC family)
LWWTRSGCALVHLDHRRFARERDIIALRTPTIASAIMIGLALFRNWLLHQLGIGLATLQIARDRSLARRGHSAAVRQAL